MSFLQASQRQGSWSKGEFKNFRKEGKIPAVVYGKGMESTSLWVNWLEFQKCYKEHGKVFEMQFDGWKETVNTKQIDTDNMGRVTHISFHKLAKGQKTSVKVPVTLEGDSIGAKAGGVIQQVLETINVTAFPKDIPESIHVDITAVQIGEHLTVGQLRLPPGLEVDEVEAQRNVVVCQAPKQQVEEEVSAQASTESEAPAAEAPAEGGEEPAA